MRPLSSAAAIGVGVGLVVRGKVMALATEVDTPIIGVHHAGVGLAIIGVIERPLLRGRMHC